jgi:hypothetical protein
MKGDRSKGKPQVWLRAKKDRTLGGRLVLEEIPTETVKRAARDSPTHTEGALLASYGGGVNKVYGNNEGTQDKAFRVTRFELAASEQHEFALIDRNGTFGYQFLEAAGAITLLAKHDEPVMVTRGTFNVRMLGSASAGTFSCSFEGVIPRFGTEAIS